jgi:hypothetical protein
VIERLSSKCETLGSNPSTTPLKNSVAYIISLFISPRSMIPLGVLVLAGFT